MRPAKAQQDDAIARPPRKRAPQRRTLETRERILDAAISEFAKRGFEGATTPAIADRAGVPHASITYHFKSKDGLWREVLRRSMTAVHERQTALLNELRGLEPTAVLRRLMEDFIQLSALDPRMVTVMHHALSTPDTRLDWLITEYVKPRAVSVSDLITQAQRAGHFVDGDPAKLRHLFVGAAVRVFMISPAISIVSGESPVSQAYIEEHTQLCLSLFFR